MRYPLLPILSLILALLACNLTGHPPDAPPASPSATVEASPAADLDLLYIERLPKYPWYADKNWPDVGEPVQFRAYIANKGDIASGPFTLRLETLDPAGNVVPGSVVEQRYDGLPAHSGPIFFEYTLAFGDGRWRDGPYQVRAQVDAYDEVDEGSLENNNVLADFTDALAVAFVVEQDVYNWVESQPRGRVEDVPEWARPRAGFHWFSQPSATPPYRAGTRSWEDWAQRQIAQINEYFYHAEDVYMDGQRHALPRLRLDSVQLVPDGAIGFANFPSQLDATPDVGWGFKEYDPIYTANNPEFMVVEWTLIHELGHHLGRHHPDVGSVWLTPLTGAIPGLPVQCWQERYGGDRRRLDCAMMSPDYSGGWGPWAAWGFFYEFQYRPGRQVRERIGAQNAGNGRWREPPTGTDHYWNVFYDDPDILSPDWRWAGNNYWIHQAIPARHRLAVIGQNGRPVVGAQVEAFRAVPPTDAERLPDGFPMDGSARWEGYLHITASGTYSFTLLTPSRTYASLWIDGQPVFGPQQWFWLDDNCYKHDQWTATLPAGVHPLRFEFQTHEGVWIGRQLALLYGSASLSIPLQPIPSSALFRDPAATQPGLTGTYYSDYNFGSVLTTRVDAQIAFRWRNQGRFDGLPDAVAVTDEYGIATLEENPFASPDLRLDNRSEAAIIRITYQDQTYYRILDLPQANIPIWKGSSPLCPEPIILDVKLDGNSGYLPVDGTGEWPPPPCLDTVVYLPIVAQNSAQSNCLPQSALEFGSEGEKPQRRGDAGTRRSSEKGSVSSVLPW